MKIIAICLLAAQLMGCKPDEEPPKPVELTNPIVWKTRLDQRALVSPPLYYNDLIILAQKNTAMAFNAETGNIVWQTPIDADPLDFQGIFIERDKVVFSSSYKTFVLSVTTGQIIWNDYLSDSRGDICHINSYIYKTNAYHEGMNKSSLYRYNIETGQRELVFTLTKGEFDKDHAPGLLMPVKWDAPNGDELLVLANRSFGWGTTGANKLDILAWNLPADSMEWYRNLDGFSSTARPAIDGDNVYFYGDHHAYCIDPATGEERWKYFIGDGPEDDFNTANIIIVKDKLIVKPDNEHIHAVNKTTGARIWVNTETEAMPYMLTERNDTIWFSSGGIWGIDANTGKKVVDDWTYGHGSWIFPVAHHPTNGHIYTSDASYLYCLDPKYMK